jgi:putative ABC transport system permease protein
MWAVLTQIRAAILRRRAQSATVLVVCLLAGGVSTMAMTLLVRSQQPFDDAFMKARGAHLIFHFDGAKVTAGDLEPAAAASGVTDAGQPLPTVLVPFKKGSEKGKMFLIGRDDAGGAIDRIPVVAGRWPQRSGEIAVTRTEDVSVPFRPHVGDTVMALGGRGPVEYRVVGEVIDLGGHGPAELDFSEISTVAWVRAQDVGAFVDAEHPLGLEMAFRFQQAATSGELAADRRAIEASLPPDRQPLWVANWLVARDSAIWIIQLVSSIIVSFTVFALLALALIVAGVVAGSVLSNYRDIGVAKAIGFTPREVVAVYVGQMAVPALLAGLLGVPLGALGSRPLLEQTYMGMQLPVPSFFDPVVAVTVPAALVLIVVVAAIVPAIRAAAADSVQAMALGTAPPPGRRSRIAAALSRLRAPRPLSLGAGDAFARPARALLTVSALAIGIATATFGIGFQNSLVSILTDDKAAYGYGQNVVVQRHAALADADVMRRLAEQSETQSMISVRQLPVKLAGRQDPDLIYAMRGNARDFGFHAVEGRWFSAPGEAVVSRTVANQSGTGIGGTIRGRLLSGPDVTLRIVGFINDFNTSGHTIRVGWDTIAAAMPAVAPDVYLVKLLPGSDAKAYVERVRSLSADYVDARVTSLGDLNFYTSLIGLMVDAFALVLMGIAAAGVFNATFLTMRERVRDIAVLKAVGMTGRQIGMMAIGSTLVLAAAGTVLGLPLGVWLEGAIWDSIGSGFGVVIDRSLGLAPLPLAIAVAAAFVLALLGAALPARWAAANPVVQVLHAE